MQHSHTEPTVLILLTPDTRWQVHEGGKGTIGATQGPYPGELLRVERGTLADQPNGRGGIAGFLNGGFEPGADWIGVWIIMTPDMAVFHVDGLGEICGQGDKTIVGHIIHPLENFRNSPAGASDVPGLAEQ